jgi:DNA-binding NarL/FixJ family response regulator
MSRVRVAVVEDHPIYRDGLAAAVADAADLEIVGSAATLAEAHRLVALGTVDVLLLDLGLPDGSGLDLLATLRAQRSTIATVVLTMNDDPQVILAAVRAGARGYLLKGAGRAEIVDGVRRAGGGGAVFHSGAADVVIAALSYSVIDPVIAQGLTAREADVLRLLAAGLTNPSIALRLGISAKTVRNQVSAVLTKLGVSDREAAGKWARRHQIGQESGRADP